jgi:hypothetical protein
MVTVTTTAAATTTTAAAAATTTTTAAASNCPSSGAASNCPSSGAVSNGPSGGTGNVVVMVVYVVAMVMAMAMAMPIVSAMPAMSDAPPIIAAPVLTLDPHIDVAPVPARAVPSVVVPTVIISLPKELDGIRQAKRVCRTPDRAGTRLSCFGTSDRSARDQCGCGSHRHNEFAHDSLPLNVTIYVCHGRLGATLISIKAPAWEAVSLQLVKIRQGAYNDYDGNRRWRWPMLLV